ncbi:MAG: hypothetical protein JNM72_05685 [Deltaproteobacteria bacterium]|nr:hypothetical protein [Deltaproteobacteria bacterium]
MPAPALPPRRRGALLPLLPLLPLALGGCVNRAELGGSWDILLLRLTLADGVEVEDEDAGWLLFQSEDDGSGRIQYMFSGQYLAERGRFVLLVDPPLQTSGISSMDLEDEPIVDLTYFGAAASFVIEADEEVPDTLTLEATNASYGGAPVGLRLELARP